MEHARCVTRQPGDRTMSCLLKRFVALSAITLVMLTSADNRSFAQAESKVKKAHPRHDVPFEDNSTKKGPSRQSAPAGAHLTYYGGRVVGSPEIIQVLWGNGAYDSHVSGVGTPSMASFYTQYTSQQTSLSSWLDSEYNTVNPTGTKTNQHIGPGTFQSQVTITPSTSATTIDDTTIQHELTAQINAGHLPAPAVDSQGEPKTIYAVFFPPGITITQGTSSSCSAGGFCAYHGTIAAAFSLPEFMYGVHPDMQAGSGCFTGCGTSSVFGNYTSVASHELVETITDPEVGLATAIGPPLAWYDFTNGEIGDICDAQQSTFAGCDGQSYTYQLEFSNAQNNCIGITTSCNLNDFSISASPSSLSGSGTSTIFTDVTSGHGTVSLVVSGTPSGATASVSPTSVAAGGSSTLTVNAGTAAAGVYTITVSGLEGIARHSTTVTLTIASGGGGGGTLTNGGFETGALNGWTASGALENIVSSGCHGGTFCAQLGSTAPTNGDSKIAQTFIAPTGATGISLWYKPTCPDTVTYDWTIVTLKDNTTATTATLLPKVCSTVGWTNVNGNLTAGHNYTLTLTSHDDNYAGDPTLTLFDDVTITTGSGVGITNGGFESAFSGWITTGASESIVTSGCHSGAACAQLGSTSPTNGDSSASQTFNVPAGKSQLSLWYKMTCPDTVTYDWVTVALGATMVVPKTCTTNPAWVNVTAPVKAGTTYTLKLISHDDNYSGDPTYTLFDDVVLN